MKYWIVGTVIALLGLGEYFYVSVAPYPPEKRMEKFVSLPIVKPLADPFLKAERQREQENRRPRRITSLDDVDPATLRLIEEAMEAGNVMGYVPWYLIGKQIGDEEIVEEAVDFFRTSETATAAWWFYTHEIRDSSSTFRDDRPITEWDLEYAVLTYRMLKEDLPELGTSEELLARWSLQRQQELNKLYDAAESGNEWSQRIVAGLEES